ncbi:hypothetical protein CEXT_703631 [Caerostris extrusa]|uniref:Uncharacterized protein n=1 Tax=Caerostris extrusa TaxID=172846 RepID=A0AAV4MZD7_CAEEX|nr:hypothetical protein CEXT_703631 [Caerostris extrusa]
MLPPGATDTATTDHSIGPSKGARESSDRIARTISNCPVCIFSVGSVAESSISGTGERLFHFTSLPPLHKEGDGEIGIINCKPCGCEVNCVRKMNGKGLKRREVFDFLAMRCISDAVFVLLKGLWFLYPCLIVDGFLTYW